MARKSTRDLDYYPAESDYAENSSGTFGSGWVPGVKTGGFPGSTAPNGAGKNPTIAASSNDAVGAPAVKGGKILYPQGGRNVSGPAGNMVSLKETPEQAQARILGTSKVSPGQTVQQMQAQNDFDKRMGFQPTHSDADIKRISDMVNPSKPMPPEAAPMMQASPTNPGSPPSAAAGSPTSPLEAIGNPPSIASEPLPSATTPLLGVPTGQEVQPSAAMRAGQTTRKAVGDLGDALTDTAGQPSGTRFARPAAAVSQPLVDVPAILGSGFRANQRVASTVAAGAKNVASGIGEGVQGFVNGFESGGGDRTASGVSNATAAQFQKPTKDNPVPVTPTTPVADVDKSQESLSRFGYSDDEFNKRKLAFAGF